VVFVLVTLAIPVVRLRDPIALLHDMSYYTPKAAQAMLEWCNERIAKNFDVGRQNPFQFSYVYVDRPPKQRGRLTFDYILTR
jgi:hypothetical protein